MKIIYYGKNKYGHFSGFKITKESDKFYGVYYYDQLITSSTTKSGVLKKKFKLMMKMYKMGFEDGKGL